MEFTEKALVLKTGKFRETDIWVRLFSPSKGQFTAFAFGGAKSKRRFLGCLDPFNEVLFRIKSSRKGGYLTLEEGRLLSSFSGIKNNHRNLGPAVNCLKFFEAAYIGNLPSHYAYEFLLDSLAILDEDADIDFFPLFFRARLCFDLGFSPLISGCHVCGKAAGGREDWLFAPDLGRIYCSECPLPGTFSGFSELPVYPSALPLLKISAGTLRTIDFIRSSSPKYWKRLSPSARIKKECYAAIDSFVRFHLGLAWENGRFVKT